MTLRRRMRPLPLDRIRMTDSFWGTWQRTLRERTLRAQWEQILQTGRLENFLRAGRGESGGFEGLYFNDSDVYKWIEACAYALTIGPDPEIEEMMAQAVSAVAGAQEPSGYLNTFFQLMHPDLKWRNLGTMHEMYCGGHLIEAAVAHHQATGSRSLLDVATRFADHVMTVFGPGKRRGYCGHQEIELALVRLADHLDEPKYAEFARWMIEERGRRPSIIEAELKDEEAMKLSPWAPQFLLKDGHYRGDYAQDHAPVREHTEVVGHAVRAMYFYAAATELAPPDDQALGEALQTVWSNLTRKRMYLTGGIGPSAKNEGFTGDYDLPNTSAYAETCAAIGLAMWGRRLL
ncbi:MAG TPA: beta-L-arabinofuranosidase domain-containing protein, partial [Fimbriimonadaceae bacterium]|nr:beta-L-arabinofuranosidase domain-containing protein [Fimbriimonadaceae bacterium]